MLQGWKTLIFGAVVTILGGLQAADVAQFVPEHWVGVVMGFIGVVIMILRVLTTTPVGEKTE